MKPNFDLTGKVAVITGAAGVLCGEMSRELAECGCKIAVLDLNGKKAQEVADDINSKGGEAIAVSTNVLDKQSLIDARKAVMDKFGRVDILLNGAGGNKKDATTGPDMSFFNIPLDALQWVFNLNFMGTVMTTQVFGEVLAEQKAGCVINISSMSAYRPLTRGVAYAAAKASITNFTEWMATYFNQEVSNNIRVNAIAPGFLLTEQNRFLLTDEKTGGDTARGKDVKKNTPMDRYGRPDELVGAIVFLASDAASFVNGIVLPVDGGFNAYSGV